MLTALQAAAAAGGIHRAVDPVPGAYIIELEPGTPAPAEAAGGGSLIVRCVLAAAGQQLIARGRTALAAKGQIQ